MPLAPNSPAPKPVKATTAWSYVTPNGSICRLTVLNEDDAWWSAYCDHGTSIAHGMSTNHTFNDWKRQAIQKGYRCIRVSISPL